MIEDDTIKLLRECNEGVKMGIRSLEEIIPEVENRELESNLRKNLDTSKEILEKTQKLLHEAGDESKEPSAMAKGMSWMKTNMKLAMEHSDSTVADLITEGCDMGIKSLQRYLNQYQAADDKAKALAKELMDAESHLREDMRAYL